MNKIKPPCPVCKAKVIGRKNKEYCSVACKTKHHEIAKKQSYKIQELDCNKFIKRNYVVLLGILRGNVKRLVLHRNVLLELGFNPFEYLEPSVRNGNVYCRILEFEYRMLNSGYVEIICTNNQKEFYAEFIDRWKLNFPDDFYLELQKCADNIIRFFKITSISYKKNPTVISFINGGRITKPPLQT